MAINKIVLNTENGEQVLVDLTGDNVTPDKMVVGTIAHDKSGEKITGTNPYELEATDTEVQTQTNLIEQIQNALVGKTSGSGGSTPTQEKTVDISENGTHEITPDDGYALSKVTVNVVVNGGTVDNRDLYQRVEFIESDRSQYIITDIVADNETGMEVVASYPVLADRIAMGSRADANATRYYCPYPLSSNSFYYGYNTGSTKSTGAKANTMYRSSLNFLNSRSARVHEELTGALEFDSALDGTLANQTGPITIFGYYRGDTGAVYSTRDIVFYGARITQGYEVVREYIPCYRKSDGEIGLYEKFTGEFFMNNGTGTFV